MRMFNVARFAMPSAASVLSREVQVEESLAQGKFDQTTAMLLA